MESAELYSKILGIAGSGWQIQNISLDEQSRALTVELTCDAHH